MLACCCVTLPSTPRTELGTPFPLETFLAEEALSPGFATLNWVGVDEEGRGVGSSKSPMSSVRPDDAPCIDGSSRVTDSVKGSS